MKSTYSASQILYSILVIGLFSVLTLAQSDGPDRNNWAGHTLAKGDIDNVNLTNGNLGLNIPLAQLSSARGSVGIGYNLTYNSKLFNKTPVDVNISGQAVTVEFLEPAPNAGWNLAEYVSLEPKKNGYLIPNQPPGYPGNSPICTLTLRLSGGTSYEMLPYGSSTRKGNSGACMAHLQNPPSSAIYFSMDGSFIRMVLEPNGTRTIYFPDGGKIVFTTGNSNPTQYVDKNGNVIVPATVTLADSSQASGYVDQVGRYIAHKFVNGEDKYYASGYDGGELVWTVKWKNVGVRRPYHAQGGIDGGPREGVYETEYCGDERVVDEVILPNGEKYEFDYHAYEDYGSLEMCNSSTPNSPGFGEVKTVTLPGGAENEFAYQIYQNLSMSELFSAPMIMDRVGKTETKTVRYKTRYDNVTSQQTEVWSYSSGSGAGSVTAPDGSKTSQFHFSTVNDEEAGGRPYHVEQPDGTVIERIWNFNNFPTTVIGSGNFNPYVKTEFTSIPNAAGQLVSTAIKDFEYDKNGNVLTVKEYDLVDYASVPRNSGGQPTGIPSGSVPFRLTQNGYHNYTANAADISPSSAAYWSVGPANLQAVSSTEVRDGANTPMSRTEINYDDFLTTANPTEVKTWDSFKDGQYRAYSAPLSTTNSIVKTVAYNSYKLPATTTDASGVQTSFTYGCIDGSTSCSSTLQNIFPTKTDVASNYSGFKRSSAATYDLNTGLVVSATDLDNNLSTVMEYDEFGRATKVRSAAGTPLESWTRTEYDDINRQVIVRSDIDVVGDGRRVSTQFFDQLGRVRLSKTLEDLTQSATNETDGIKVETRYSTGNPNSYKVTSNPFRSDSATQAINEPTMGWTRSMGSNTGRRSEIETFSGAALPTPWGNNANSTGVVATDADAAMLQSGKGASVTVVTDQAGKKRRSLTNALGHLIRVDEPDENNSLGAIDTPYQPTAYTYDVLNNLVTVTQASSTTAQCGGASLCSQTRSFSYSSLSRLKSAANPESGTINYLYDSNGNLTSKTDARGVQTDYVYDKLNRITSRSYSTPSGTPSNYQASPNVTYSYRTTAPGIGALASVSTGTGANASTTEYVTLDILGRVTRSKQTTDGVVYGDDANPMTYSYNLSGALIEQQYPSGRKVRNELDASGNLALVESKKNASNQFWTYANRFSYNAAGALTSMQLGNGRWESTTFNSRLQPTQLALGKTQNATDLLDLDYSYGTTANNGNVMSQTITAPTAGATPGFTAVQNYSYDSLNRLNIASETLTPTTGSPETWIQEFKYDRYGNRKFDEQTTTTLPKECGTAPNHVVCPDDPKINPSANPNNNKLIGYSFDAAGNTKLDAENRKFTYDSENKQVKVETVSGTTVTGTVGEYFYDGDGRRIKKRAYDTNDVLTEETIFVYDALGKLIGEYSNETASPQDANVAYLTSDHLGSPRINTDINGNIIARHDYLPFGEEIASSKRVSGIGYASDTVRKQFTGYERDRETELDFAQARMYSSTLGRFSTVDPMMASADVVNPQTFNRYVYVGNNPVNITDPSGMIWGALDGKIFWYESMAALKGAGASVHDSLIGSVNGQLVALNPNGPSKGTPGFSFITSNTAALQDIARLGATAAQLSASAAILAGSIAGAGPLLIGAGIVIAAGGVVYLYTQYPAAAGRLKAAGCPAYIECPSIDDQRLMEGRYEMTNAGDNASDASSTSTGESTPATPDPNDNKPTDHAKERQREARSDPNRDVGDPNRVASEGRPYRDNRTGYTVYVKGNRVTVYDGNRRVTQFKNSRKNTQRRVQSGRWSPL